MQRSFDNISYSRLDLQARKEVRAEFRVLRENITVSFYYVSLMIAIIISRTIR